MHQRLTINCSFINIDLDYCSLKSHGFIATECDRLSDRCVGIVSTACRETHVPNAANLFILVRVLCIQFLLFECFFFLLFIFILLYLIDMGLAKAII